MVSKRLRRIYVRRRVAALVALLLCLAIVCGLIWGISSGIRGFSRWMHRDDINAISRQSAPSPRAVSGVSNCSANDISLELKASPTTVSVGGSIQFSATIAHTNSRNCLINASNASRVLTITSGNQTVWKSDVCPVSSRMLLLSGSDKDIQTLVWNTDATGSSCQSDAELQRVKAGTYQARLSMKDDASIASDPVAIIVE